MKSLYYGVAILVLTGLGVQADQQTTQSGKQRMTVRRTTKPVVIDGAFSPGEWSAAIPVHVDAVKPGQAPGLVPFFINPPQNQDDLSYKVDAMYDDDYLYIAVDVADDVIISDNPELPRADEPTNLFTSARRGRRRS
jgi:hypothetical protein